MQTDSAGLGWGPRFGFSNKEMPVLRYADHTWRAISEIHLHSLLGLSASTDNQYVSNPPHLVPFNLELLTGKQGFYIKYLPKLQTQHFPKFLLPCKFTISLSQSGHLKQERWCPEDKVGQNFKKTLPKKAYPNPRVLAHSFT